MKEKYIVYIGDFDFRNENVQSFLVKNNGNILNSLGYKITYIGVNTDESCFKKIENLSTIKLSENNIYFELPDTLNLSGVFKCSKVCKTIISYLDRIVAEHALEFVISYQSPTYSIAINKVAKWCKRKGIKYIVNCADLPIFKLQSFPKCIIMKANWDYLHRVNKQYADGIIAVSKYIKFFYQKQNCQYVIIPPLFDASQRKLIVFEPEDITSFIYAGLPFKNTGYEIAPKGMKDRLDKIIDLFLELSSRGISYRFRVVGITKEDYLTGVPRHRANLSEKSKIEFIGRRSHSETLLMVANADFSINYRDENLMTKAGFSTKIVESISMGTPVIINPISDTFDYLKDGISGFKLSGNVQNDAMKISSLCFLSKDERKNLKNNLCNEKIFDTSKFLIKMNTFLCSLKTFTTEVK